MLPVYTWVKRDNMERDRGLAMIPFLPETSFLGEGINEKLPEKYHRVEVQGGTSKKNKTGLKRVSFQSVI